jgi:hypothetical protein
MAVATALFPKPLQQEYDWAFAHYAQLVKRYPDQWVAFAHRRVVAAGRNLARVLERAHEQVDWPEIPHLFVEKGIHVYAHRP